ncbi:type II secretion system protein [Marinobacterium sp. YM272]|uniref:type II secretion system protein n=1 Tax=Marinobacterium sp. YM272 TaxID=3421654 RepID=UPI003D7FAD6F
MRRTESGFTLIEVLVALVVLAFVATSAQMAIAQYIDQQALTSSRYKGHWAAWNGAMEIYRQSHWDQAGIQDALAESESVLGTQWSLESRRVDTLGQSLQRVEVIATANDDAASKTSVVLFVSK